MFVAYTITLLPPSCKYIYNHTHTHTHNTHTHIHKDKKCSTKLLPLYRIIIIVGDQMIIKISLSMISYLCSTLQSTFTKIISYDF
jgi:hypothetical protein